MKNSVFLFEKRFFSVLAGLALPIALQDLIKFSLALADNIMVGSISETALGAVTLAGQPFFVFSLLSFGIASGGGVLVAQYYGKHDQVLRYQELLPYFLLIVDR